MKKQAKKGRHIFLNIVSVLLEAKNIVRRMLIPDAVTRRLAGRALGRALTDARVFDAVQYENKGGAAGVIGLAQFINSAKGDPNQMIVMGAVMLGGIITGKPPVGLDKVTPLARLTTEYNVFVLPADSPFKTMKDVVEQLKKDPGSVKWGGGSRGSTEHIAAAMIARQVGADPARILSCVETVLRLPPAWVPPTEYMVRNVSDTVVRLVTGFHIGLGRRWAG
jgi:hypothetical protein